MKSRMAMGTIGALDHHPEATEVDTMSVRATGDCFLPLAHHFMGLLAYHGRNLRSMPPTPPIDL